MTGSNWGAAVRSNEKARPGARGRLVLALVFPVLAAFLSMAAPATQAADNGPAFSHILILILENQGYEDVIGSKDAPFINAVLEKQYASASRFYAPYHNSPSDYYALASGRTYVKGDGGDWGGTCLPSMTCSTDDMSVFQQLNEAGKSWKVYSEDQDRNCQILNAKKYWVGHNPAVFYRNLGPNGYATTGNGSCATSDVPYTELAQDLAANSLPELGFLVPNNCNNMHDKCPPVSNQIKQSDTWLAQQLTGDATVPGGLIGWARAHDTLLVITMDEARSNDAQFCCPYASAGGGGHVPTWVIGPPDKVRSGGFRSEIEYSLYSILRTVEQNFSLPLLGHAADPAVLDLTDFLPSRIELDHGSGVAGSRVKLKGKDFAAGERVDVLWNCSTADCPDGRVIASITADRSGAFQTMIGIPGNETSATHALGARGSTSSLFGYAPFTIKPPLSVTPGSGAHAEQIQLRGAGYGPNERVVIYWDCPTAPCPESNAIGSARTDAFGAFDGVTLAVPARARKGTYGIQAVGEASRRSAGVSFQITEALSLSPISGVSSSKVLVSGRSFGPNERINLVWDCKSAACDSTTLLGTAVTDANGDFRDVTVTVPSVVQNGNFAVGAMGETIYSFARDWFKVKEPLSLFPATGPPGKNVSVSAAGFAEDEEVKILWNCDRKGCPGGISLGSSLTDDNGELSAVQVAIPEGIVGGTYHVSGLGLTSGTFASTTVKVTPQLRTSPARGANGWTATLKGVGFGPGQPVEILWDCDGTGCQGKQPVAVVTTDSIGSFDGVKIRIPEAAPVGAHSLTAQVKGSQTFATSSFSVETSLSISPKRGASGWNATIVGTGFGPSESVSLIWDCAQAECPGNQILRSMTANQNGSFEVKVLIPPGAKLGDHELGARGDQTRSFAHGTYSVTPAVAGASNGDLAISIGGINVRVPPFVPAGLVVLLAMALMGRTILRRRQRRLG